LEILKYPDPKLREEGEPVRAATIATKEFRHKCWDMVRAMKAANGVGLAATQVGWDSRVFVMHNADGKNRIVINPSWSPVSNRKYRPIEGCLSFPEDLRYIERFQDIRLIYTDITGSTRHELFSGLDAQIVQHETDHLDGILFIDHDSTVNVKRRNANAG
jgi:peptide deformylase